MLRPSLAARVLLTALWLCPALLRPSTGLASDRVSETGFSDYWDAYERSKEPAEGNAWVDELIQRTYQAPEDRATWLTERTSEIQNMFNSAPGDLEPAVWRAPNTAGGAPVDLETIDTTPEFQYRGRFDAIKDIRVEPIRRVIRDYGRFPGGIILDGSASADLPIHRIKYDDSQFELNGTFRFDPRLAAEEVAILWHSVFQGDGYYHFGAVGQDAFQGVDSDSVVAINLALSDTALGAVAYGFDTTRAVTNTGIPAWVNPRSLAVTRLASGDQEALRRYSMAWHSGLEPRLFLQMGRLAFRADPVRKRLVAGPPPIAIHFQIFARQDHAFTFPYSEPAEMFPEVSSAVDAMTASFGRLLEEEPALIKAISYGETLAFLRLARQLNLRIEGSAELQAAYDGRQRLPTRWDTYTSRSREYVELHRHAADRLRRRSAGGSGKAQGEAELNVLLALFGLYQAAGQVGDARWAAEALAAAEEATAMPPTRSDSRRSWARVSRGALWAVPDELIIATGQLAERYSASDSPYSDRTRTFPPNPRHREHFLRMALTLTERALAADPAAPALRAEYGRLSGELGDIALAEASIRRALLDVPDAAPWMVSLACVIQREGRPEEAVKLVEAASRSDPAHGEGYWATLHRERQLPERPTLEPGQFWGQFAKDDAGRAIIATAELPTIYRSGLLDTRRTDYPSLRTAFLRFPVVEGAYRVSQQEFVEAIQGLRGVNE